MSTATAPMTEKQQKMLEFREFCETSNQPYDAATLVEYDKKFKTGLLDHQKAKEEGYYYHLQMQARNLITLYGAQTISLAGGASVTLQDDYAVPDEDGYLVRKSVKTFTKDDTKYLISVFQAEARAKLTRLYLLKSLPLAAMRKMVQRAYEETEAEVHDLAKIQRKA